MQTDRIPAAEAVCKTCDGRCCIDACPPLTRERIRIILSHGDYQDCIVQNGYRYIKTGEDGRCVMIAGGRCRIHAFKPETCVAGPFTFSVTGPVIEIFLKRECMCPLVAHIKGDPGMYEALYTRAVRNISRLLAALPDDEITLISRIPEPETDKVAELPFCQR